MHNDFTTPYAASVPSPLGDAAEHSPCLQLSAVLQRAAAMLMVATMITVALSSVPDMPIHILCNDLLANDWMVLMNQLEEQRGTRPDELKNVCPCNP